MEQPNNPLPRDTFPRKLFKLIVIVKSIKVTESIICFVIQQLLSVVEHDMKNYNWGLDNSSYYVKAEFNNCFITYLKNLKDYNTFRTCVLNSSK